MGRKPNTEVRRAEIIAALKTELSEAGYAAASIRRIAQRAGLAPGLVHYHFACKEDILLALIAQLSQNASNWQPPGDSPKAQLQQRIDRQLGLGPQADPEGVRAWVAICGEALRAPTVAKAIEQLLHDEHQRWQSLLQSAGHKNPAAAAAAALAMLQGAFTLAVLTPNRLPSGYAATQLHLLLDQCD